MSEAKTAIVTGASVGIGTATAKRFLDDGYRVIGIARRPCPVDGVETLQADLASFEGMDAAVAALKERLGEGPRELVWVHNAAMMPADSAGGLDPREMERAMRLNVVAPAHLTASLRPLMAEGSSVVLIGSTLSEKAVPGALSYVTSKHAVLGLMRSTVQDFFGQGIHAVAVCPGFTDTAMLRPRLEADPELEKAVLSMVAFGRLLKPEEIAEVVHFAANNPSLNGSVLHANLGQREA
jgi:3-oxoacyl-[acyl-carrier protein] reductase